MDLTSTTERKEPSPLYYTVANFGDLQSVLSTIFGYPFACLKGVFLESLAAAAARIAV